MKRALLLIIFCAALIFAQDEIKIDSKVISATVFKNRALVAREADMNFSKGKHKIIISNLPVDLIDESVRISTGGSDAVKVLDVKVEKRFTTETRQKKTKDMENEIDSLNQLIQVVSDKILILNSKKEFIESLKAQASKYVNEKMMMSINNTKGWGDMLSYVENNMNEIYKGLREQNRKKSFLEQEIQVLNSEISKSQESKAKDYKEVLINIETENKGNVTLYPSYLVENAGWYPVYDARVMSQTKQMELSYFGMLHQSTGEGWNNISLTLSTAEPLSLKILPKMERWFVDIKPLYVTNYPGMQSGVINVKGGRSYNNNTIEGTPLANTIYTDVHAGELSTTFEVPAKSSIPSDNTPHKVTIAIGNFKTAFRYTAVPKISPGVYLNGKMVNTKDYPLLQGELNVFVDNDFINRTFLNTIVPTDTFELALGIDERMQAKKVLVNKFQETKGFLGGKKQITYEYEIQLQNKRQTEETIVVYDQVPIPMNEDIKVELLEPKKDLKDLGNDQKLEWKITLAPGEKKNIPVKYTILYPDNLTV